MRSEGNRGRNRAFTLVELLLVISIIVILISVLLVGYRSINYTLKEKGCQNNLAKIGAVLNQYCQQNRGFYPDAERSWGSYFRRYSPPNTVKGQEYWTYLSNVRQLKDMGASDALFTCPFYQAPNPLPALWSTLGTFDTPKGPYKDGPGEINVTISCGGVSIKPGDILVGDGDGLVVIDPKEAPEILAKAKATVAKEAGIMEDIINKKWDRSWVDKALRDKGCEFID